MINDLAVNGSEDDLNSIFEIPLLLQTHKFPLASSFIACITLLAKPCVLLMT